MNLFKSLACSAIVAMASVASAIDYDWNVSDGDFNTGTNWADPNGVTGMPVFNSTNYAYIRNGGVSTISGNSSIQALRLGYSKMVPDMTAEPNMIDDPNNPGNLIQDPNWVRPNVDVGSTGKLVIAGGSIVGPTNQAPQIIIGNNYKGEGVMNAGIIDFGTSTTGVMTIGQGSVASTFDMNGGTMKSLASFNGNNGINVRNGTFNMNGGLLALGNAGQRQISLATGSNTTATFNFSGGSIVGQGGVRIATSSLTSAVWNQTNGVYAQLTGDFSVGYNNAGGVEANMGYGTANVDGTIDIQNSSKLIVGDRGPGTLNLTGGSIYASNSIRVGNDGNARGLINQTGGTISTPGGVSLRDSFSSTAAVNGAPGVWVLNGANAVIDNHEASSNATFRVGNKGMGTLDIRQGNANLDILEMGADANSNSTVLLSGGKLTLKRYVYTTSTAATKNFSFTGGTLAFEPVAGQTPTFHGLDLVNNGGKLVINQGVRNTLTVGGLTRPSNFIMNSGSWDIDVSNDALLADKVSVASGSGSLLGGVINVNLLNTIPTPGQTFDIVTGTAAATVSGITVSSDEWAVIANGNNIQLQYIPEPATMSLLVLGGMAMLRRRRA